MRTQNISNSNQKTNTSKTTSFGLNVNAETILANQSIRKMFNDNSHFNLLLDDIVQLAKTEKRGKVILSPQATKVGTNILVTVIEGAKGIVKKGQHLLEIHYKDYKSGQLNEAYETALKNSTSVS